jgi:16S rRNA (guanine1207-N2)-methyltransferase
MKNQSDIGYTKHQRLTAKLRGQEIVFISKPGLPDWDRVSPSATLLAEKTSIQPGAKVLWLGCGHSAAVVPLAQQDSEYQFTLMDANFIALQMTRQTLAINQLNNVHVHESITVLPDQAGSYDFAMIDLPKGRQFARRWLVEAYYALRPGGKLYLSGAKNQGIKSIARDAENLFGSLTVVAYKKGNRLLRLVKSEKPIPTPAWLNEAGVAPGTWHKIDIQTRRHKLNLYSLPGVFSYHKLDLGTKLLLEQINYSPGERVLDLGCGYGIIGLTAALSDAEFVDLVDTNLLSIASAQKNLLTHQVSNAQAVPSDAFSNLGGKPYHLILSNPPFHAGKAVEYQITQAFIHQSFASLEIGGRLLLVANKFIRYDQLMQSVFNNVQCLAETNQYHVLSSTK